MDKNRTENVILGYLKSVCPKHLKRKMISILVLSLQNYFTFQDFFYNFWTEIVILGYFLIFSGNISNFHRIISILFLILHNCFQIFMILSSFLTKFGQKRPEIIILGYFKICLA